MSTKDADRDDLLRRFREGDHSAFRELTAPLKQALEARAGRRLSPRMQKKLSVADVVQEAFVVAFERRTKFEDRGPDSLRRWLLAIVDNRAKKAVERIAGTAKRDLERELTGAGRPATVELVGRDHSPSQMAMAKELTELVEQARGRLCERDRELLRLTHDEGLPLREVAARLGRSYEATKKAHARALLRFGEEIRRQEKPGARTAGGDQGEAPPGARSSP